MMNDLDDAAHLLGAGLLIILGTLSLRLEGKRLKRRVSKLIMLVLGVLLADAFVYRSGKALDATRIISFTDAVTRGYGNDLLDSCRVI